MSQQVFRVVANDEDGDPHGFTVQANDALHAGRLVLERNRVAVTIVSVVLDESPEAAQKHAENARKHAEARKSLGMRPEGEQAPTGRQVGRNRYRRF